MLSNMCFQLFELIFVKTPIFSKSLKLEKSAKPVLYPPKFQYPEKMVKMRNYTPPPPPPPMLNTDRHRWLR